MSEFIHVERCVLRRDTIAAVNMKTSTEPIAGGYREIHKVVVTFVPAGQIILTVANEESQVVVFDQIIKGLEND